jgi:hypothetical protein
MWLSCDAIVTFAGAAQGRFFLYAIIDTCTPSLGHKFCQSLW